MEYLATEKEAKEIDKVSIEEFGIPSAVLMERAALKVCAAVEMLAGAFPGKVSEGQECGVSGKVSDGQECGVSRGISGGRDCEVSDVLPGSDEKSRESMPFVLAVCGTGNNGGDAAAAARMLYEKGYRVEILITGEASRFSEMMKMQVDILENLGIPVNYAGNYLPDENNGKSEKKTAPAGEEISELTGRADFIIDGIFGIGLSREVSGLNKDIIKMINGAGARVVSVDVPSGINAGTGQIMGTAVKADVTVTFGVMKKGLVFFPGHMYAGRVLVKDCGFPAEAVKRAGIRCYITKERDLRDLPDRKPHSNKGSYGRVLVIAGSEGMSGAAYFSAMAAYRTGTGLVKIFTHANNETALKSLVPEALFSFYDGGEPDLGERLYKEIEWAKALVIGPGLSKSATADFLVKGTLEYMAENEDKCPVIMDADAITLSAAWSGEEKKRLVMENPYIVMTPHLKEMAVFMGTTTDKIQENVSDAQKLLPEFKGTLVLKDDRTVTCRMGEAFVNTRGCNGLATGGSGDVLTGILAGFLAQRGKPEPDRIFRDAALGVTFHAMAGEEAAKIKGNAGMLARDILDGICKIKPENMAEK